MNETQRLISRRAALGASALAAVSSALGCEAANAATNVMPDTSGDPRRPILPVRAHQPKDTRLTMLGTSGGPPPDYVRTGISSVLTVQGRNYVVDAGRSSVTQYLNAGLLFSALKGIYITHLHADHIADYYNYFLLAATSPTTRMTTWPDRLSYTAPGQLGHSRRL